MKGIKIVTIGGGSSYTPELVEGFIKRYDELPVKELWLVDIEEGQEKLEIVGHLAKRMVKKAEVDMNIYLSLDRRAALKDADFVTTQFRVGQLDAREKDELIPLKYGVIGQETNGPGGMFKGLRTIPVIFDIIKDCQELCPDAWIVSFTNPSGMNAEAVFRHTNWKKFIGLCNGPVNMIKDIEKILGAKSEDQVNVKTEESLKNIVDIPWSAEFLRSYGFLGIGYLRYYLQKQQMLEHCQEDAKKHQCRAQVVKKVEKELFEKYKDENLDMKPKELEQRGGAYYSDAACNLISSLYNNKGDIQVVDTLNQGAISNLPDDVVVEVSSVITKDGPKPIPVGDLPIQTVGLIQQLKAFEILTTDVAVSGNYDDALVTMTINPLVQSEMIAKKILDEMLEAHKQYLPQFFKL